MKKFYLFIFLSVVLSTLFAVFFLLLKAPDKKSLKILTYSSFAGVYGPGRLIKKSFESFCDCEVQWFLAEDSTALLQRFSMIPNIDLVIGWDQITFNSAQKEQWVNLSFLREEFIENKNLFSKAFFQTSHFLPIDWAPIGFLYKKKFHIKNLKSLFEIEGQISFPEPRTSTLGLQLYYWIYEVFKGDTKQISVFLKRLKEKVYGPVFSWSMAYGFFQKGQTDMSLSYLSSLLYHQKEEPEEPYFFAYFEEGQAYQVEYVSLSQTSQNKELALDFVKFLLSKKIQELIQEKHYMFPVSKEITAHKLLKQKELQFISYKSLETFLKKKKELFKLWEENFY